MKSSIGYLPEAEALRGLAIALVFLFHADLMLHFGEGVLTGSTVSPLFAFVRAGHTGVSLFFVLSAFLLSGPFLKEATGGPRVRRSTYVARRALRILPLYYAAVVIASALCANRLSDLLHGLPYLIFLNTFAGGTPALPGHSELWWSLATEVQFYALLPLLPLFLRSQLGRLFGAVLLALYVPGYWAFAHGRLHLSTIDGQLALARSVFGRAPQFGFGIFVAWLYSHWGMQIRAWCAARPWMRNGGCDALFIATLTALGFLLQAVIARGQFSAEGNWLAWHVLEGALWAAVLLVVLAAPGRLTSLLVNPILLRLGVISYSVYLVHGQLLAFGLVTLRRAQLIPRAGWNTPNVLAIVFLALACLAVSTATYVLIERPFLRRKRRLAAERAFLAARGIG